MTKAELFALADKQVAQLTKLHNAQSRSRQIVMLCQTLKLALKGGN